MMQQHIEFTEKALAAIQFMLDSRNVADAKSYLHALIESGIRHTVEQGQRINSLFAACYQ